MAPLTAAQRQQLCRDLATSIGVLLVAEGAVVTAVAGSSAIDISWPDTNHAVDGQPTSAWTVTPLAAAQLPQAQQAAGEGYRITLVGADAGEVLAINTDGAVTIGVYPSGANAPTIKDGSLAPTQTPAPIRDSFSGQMDRRLVVYEANPRSPDAGQFIAVDPATSFGVPIPTAEVRPTLPQAGSVRGELVYEAATSRGYVWDGSRWRDLNADVISRYNDEASLLADLTPLVGKMAVAADTGVMYIMSSTAGGTPVWKRIGTADYATIDDLWADTPGRGTVGHAMDEDTFWQYTGTSWLSTSVRPFPTSRDVFNWGFFPAGHVGDRAIARDVGVLYVRGINGWTPESVLSMPTLQILNVDWAINGQEAIATDTSRKLFYGGSSWQQITGTVTAYVDHATLQAATPPDGDFGIDQATGRAWERSGGAWVDRGLTNSYTTAQGLLNGQAPAYAVAWLKPSPAATDFTGGTFHQRTLGNWVDTPWVEFPTMTSLQAATPSDGTVALSMSPPRIAFRDAGVWRTLEGPHFTEAATPDPAAVTGDFFHNSSTGALGQLIGGNYVSIAGPPVGAVMMYAAAAAGLPAGWLVCDGSAIPAQYTDLIALIGNNTPDLTNQFVRGGAPEAGFTKHRSTTARPRTAYQFGCTTSGNHTHAVWTIDGGGAAWRAGGYPSGVARWSGHEAWGPGDGAKGAGSHHHTVTLNGGGDSETAPDHVLLLYIIRAC